MDLAYAHNRWDNLWESPVITSSRGALRAWLAITNYLSSFFFLDPSINIEEVQKWIRRKVQDLVAINWLCDQRSNWLASNSWNISSSWLDEVYSFLFPDRHSNECKRNEMDAGQRKKRKRTSWPVKHFSIIFSYKSGLIVQWPQSGDLMSVRT